MRLLLLGGSRDTRQTIKRLLGESKHQLEWYSEAGGAPVSNPRTYDMVLVDGDLGSCSEMDYLLDMAHQIKERAPDLPILVLSFLGADTPTRRCGKRSSGSCGVTRSPGGVWYVHCRLKDLAWNETAALLRDRLERTPQDPVTFEFQG